MKMNRVFLLTGSNRGESLRLMNTAVRLVGEELGQVVRESRVYCSEPWGYSSSALFYNQSIEIASTLSADSILEKILEIETRMGRIRLGEGYSDREMDIDILFYGDEIIEKENLAIPHPRMHLRRFALVPMEEIAPNLIHPVFNKSISQLLTTCTDSSAVVEISQEL